MNSNSFKGIHFQVPNFQMLSFLKSTDIGTHSGEGGAAHPASSPFLIAVLSSPKGILPSQSGMLLCGFA